MIEGTPKTKAPTIVAAVVIPITRLSACKAYTRCATLTSAGDGSPGTTIVSDISVVPLFAQREIRIMSGLDQVKSSLRSHNMMRLVLVQRNFDSKPAATRCKRTMGRMWAFVLPEIKKRVAVT